MARTAVQRPETLETMTYARAIKVALRRCGFFLKQADRDIAVALVFPPDAVFESYEVALGKVLKQAALADKFSIARVVIDKRGKTISAEAILEVSRRECVIILVEQGAVLPREIVVAVDRVVDVGTVKPRHLISAAREVWDMTIHQEEAQALCSYPPQLLFAVMRRGRPVDIVLKKLSGSQPRTGGSWEPLIQDLDGYGHAKTWALDLVEDLNAWREGRIHWRDVDTGLLLSGPPGTGKTLFASALARSCRATFISTSSAQWQAHGHLGDMLGAMRKTFRDAADKAPTVLFIDEFDSIGDRRTFSGDNASYSMQVVNALLELLDGADRREGVVVVAASNYPEHIDAAFRRPGRLDRHAVIELPDRAAREQMLALHLGTDISRQHVKDIAAAIGGYTGAHIEQLARDARRIARRAGREVEIADVLKFVPPLLPLLGDERRAVCFHEAGHAVVGLALNVGVVEMIVVAKDIGHREENYGHVQWVRQVSKHRTHQSYLDEIALLMGGMAAERVHLGTKFDGSGGAPGSDLQRAVDLATLMFAKLGFEALQFHDVSRAAELDELRRSDPILRQRVERLLETQLERSENIIRLRADLMETLVAALNEREVILGAEVMHLFRDNRIN